MKEAPKSFHLVSGPSDAVIRQRVADQTGLSARDVSLLDLYQISQWRNKQEVGVAGWYALKKGDERLLTYLPTTGDTSECFQALEQAVELGYDLDAQRFSYGIFGLNYLRGLLAHRGKMEKLGICSEKYSSLLLGALTPDTVREFATIVHTAFPDEAECHVIDLESGAKAETMKDIVDFRVANAMHLPYADNTMHSVQTNALFPFLSETEGLSNEAARQQVFSEVSRVLAPSGIFLMVEDTRFDLTK